MENSEPKPRSLKTIFTKQFRFLESEFGFWNYKSRWYLRESKFVIQGIIFDIRMSGGRLVSLNPHVWPLIVPRDSLPLHPGGMVRHLSGKCDTEEYTIGRAEGDYTQIESLTQKTREVAIPFLDDSADIPTLASKSYQGKWPKFWSNSTGTNKVRCYLYAYAREYELFEACFQSLKAICSTDDREWAIREWAGLNEVRDNIHDRDVLRTIFKRNIDYCIREMKIEKLDIQSELRDIMPD